jgi:CO dehydrogenase/acetyl-CoA synthase alpha subunit
MVLLPFAETPPETLGHYRHLLDHLKNAVGKPIDPGYPGYQPGFFFGSRFGVVWV